MFPMRYFWMSGWIWLASVLAAGEPEVVFQVPDGTAAITPADVEGVKYPQMLFPAPETQGLEDWILNKAKDPSVVWFQNRYWMYFSLFPKSSQADGVCLAIGIATSEDLKNWNVVGIVRPLTEIDRKGCGAPCAKVWDGRVHLFYQSYGNGPKDTILYATSEDGIHFTPHPDNPIFSPEGNWTNGRAIDADFITFQGKCFLYVATRDPAGKVQKLAVAVAENRDQLGRKHWRQAVDGSILEPQFPWETLCIEAPSVLERDGKLFMFYAGGYNNDPQHIGVAESTDGLHWKRLWRVPFLTNGPTDQWNASESGHPGIFEEENGRTWLFFQGNATRGKTWFLSRVPIGWKDGRPYVLDEP